MIPIKYTAKGIGKFIADSKMEHTWDFQISGTVHKVICKESKISKNFEIILNNQIIYKGNSGPGDIKNFTFDFFVNSIQCSIV